MIVFCDYVFCVEIDEWDEVDVCDFLDVVFVVCCNGMGCSGVC